MSWFRPKPNPAPDAEKIHADNEREEEARRSLETFMLLGHLKAAETHFRRLGYFCPRDLARMIVWCKASIYDLADKAPEEKKA